jgi:valyl-tRNA synthetase
MTVYKLFWDEFSSWYLEIIKPAYQQPVDAQTLFATLRFFDSLLKVLHPFMPFITEELWQAIEDRTEGESIMLQRLPEATTPDDVLLEQFSIVKEIIAGIRAVRLQKNIPNKERVKLQIIGTHNAGFDRVIETLCHIETMERVNEKDIHSVSFLVVTTQYAVAVPNLVPLEADRQDIEAKIRYYEGFLSTVVKKLSNAKFVANAKPEVVAMEQKKKSDAESKLQSLHENLSKLQKE